MYHVDALSRSTNILIVNENTFDYALAALQNKDQTIKKMITKIEKEENSLYEIVDGLLYRKIDKGLKFYVPQQMEHQIIQKHYDSLGHL